MTADLGATLPGGDVLARSSWAEIYGTASFMAEHTIIETGRRPVTGGAANMLLAIDMSGYTGRPRKFRTLYKRISATTTIPNGVFVMNIPAHGMAPSLVVVHGQPRNPLVYGQRHGIPDQNTGGQPTMAFGQGL